MDFAGRIVLLHGHEWVREPETAVHPERKNPKSGARRDLSRGRRSIDSPVNLLAVNLRIRRRDPRGFRFLATG